MAINFLRYFDLEKNRTNIDYKKMGDLICSCLDDDYLPSKGVNLKKMTKVVNGGGVNVGSEAIRRDLKVIQLTRRFFYGWQRRKKGNFKAGKYRQCVPRLFWYGN